MIRLTLGVATCTVFLFWGLYYTMEQSPREQLILRASPPSQLLKVSSLQQQQQGGAFVAAFTIPPLDTLIETVDASTSQSDTARIVAPVDFLLDFAIVGYAKTATTFVLNWLGHHPDIRMHPHEVHKLTRHDPVGMVQSLYTLQEADPREKHQELRYGYKAPRDIADATTMQLLSTYWPDTKLIVGVRHPVLWFQSFYNYRLLSYSELPPPATLVGPCQMDVANNPQHLDALIQQHHGLHDRGVCTDLARFHVHLHNHLLMNRRNNTRTRHPVFLYIDEQLRDTQHVPQLQHDLQTYLGLSTPLSNPIEYRTGMNTTAINSATTANENAFDICHSEFISLRVHLLQIGQKAASWLVEHFLPLPGVTVSCPSCVIQLLETWHIDPCDDAA